MGAVTGPQRLLGMLVPRGVLESLEAGTRRYFLECPCGSKRDLWDAGGLRYKGNEETTYASCPACGKRTWQKKRLKTHSELMHEIEEGTRHRVFLSGHAWWATLMVWGSSALIWTSPFLVLVDEPGSHDFWSMTVFTFVLGWMAPWLWLTTRYRITDTHLVAHSGFFRKSLELRRITEVSKTRKGLGMSFAFDTELLWVGYPTMVGGIVISPEERLPFVLELAKVCPHLEHRGGELVPRER